MDAYQERLDSGKVSKFYAQVGIKGFNVRSVAFKFVLNSIEHVGERIANIKAVKY